jgi:hypothetical protein
MSKPTQRQSLLAALDEVFGPTPEIPANLSPKDATMFIDATDDNASAGRQHQKELPHCKDTGKVCYPSRRVATATAHRAQKKRNTFLRVYFCDHCKYHHLTSQKP